MSSTLLEQARQLHEDMEQAERLVAKDLKRTMTRYKDRLQQDHRTKRFVDCIQESARKLIKIYNDEDGVRRAEIEKLGGQNQFSSFYERLKTIKEYYRKHPTQELTDATNEEEVIDSEVPLEFTGEEMYGRYLDLHDFYQTYINIATERAKTKRAMRGAQGSADPPLDYITYVQTFTHFHTVPRPTKLLPAYSAYLEKLLRYLIGFHERTQPLKPVVNLLEKVEDEFDRQWDAGELLGWEDHASGLPQADAADLVVDLDKVAQWEELLELGADQLKAALQARGMKCGGRIEERAQRLFLAKGRELSSLDKSLFPRGAEPAPVLDDARREVRLKAAKAIAKAESKVLAVVDSLGGVIEDTKAWVEKKLAQNYEELKRDMEMEDFDVGQGDSDEEDEYVYNPLKLPSGPDGKPIPYWLYKLHGLNQEYRCEICGGDLFRGRREYERHFRDGKHVRAMQALGIPSSKAFFEITKVEEAQALWESLKKRGTGNWNADLLEEFEDDEGNVYNKKTYLDLQRQGLV